MVTATLHAVAVTGFADTVFDTHAVTGSLQSAIQTLYNLNGDAKTCNGSYILTPRQKVV